MKLLAKITNPVLEGTGLDSPAPGEARGVFGTVLSGIIEILLFIGFIYFLVTFILGGISWIASEGDEGKVKEARDKITNAIIGLGLVFSVFVIVKLLGQVFGITALENLGLPLVPISN